MNRRAFLVGISGVALAACERAPEPHHHASVCEEEQCTTPVMAPAVTPPEPIPEPDPVPLPRRKPDTFPRCLANCLISEGGYSNDRNDPGGPTNFGITIHDYRKYVKPKATAADVKAMKVEEAAAIYRPHYWDILRCDELPAGLDYCIFDYAVSSGVARAGKVLRRVLGLSANDWHVTDAVLAAVARKDPAALITAICAERLRFLKGLRTWKTFGGGWGRRVASVKRISLRMADPAVSLFEVEQELPEFGPGKAYAP